MESTEEGRLDFNHELSKIPEGMLEGHVLPTLAKHTIVGLGVLCDHGCVVVLTREKAYIMHENRLILSGSRKPGHLWFLNPQDTKKAPTVSELITSGGEESVPPPSYLDTEVGMLEGHVLPTLAKHTIVGLGVLCDHGCVVVLTREKAYIGMQYNCNTSR